MTDFGPWSSAKFDTITDLKKYIYLPRPLLEPDQ